MRFQHVGIAAVTLVQPPHVVTSDELERRLAPVYEKARLPAGRLELMTGIRERRFWDPGTRSSDVAARAGRAALEASGLPPERMGLLIHASVCRDFLEPATAALVHERLGLPETCAFFDLGNACLGVLSGMVAAATQIELGHIDAALIVSGELAEPLYRATLQTLLAAKKPDKKLVKRHFASLTIGSAAAAVVVARRELAPEASAFLGGAAGSDATANRLCRGGEAQGADGVLMDTDSEGLLHAGCALADRTCRRAFETLGWDRDTPRHIFTHQVGRAHQRRTFELLGLDEAKDYPTVSFMGNTGSAALPGAWALGRAARPVAKDDPVLLLGIGSGLSCLALGVSG